MPSLLQRRRVILSNTTTFNPMSLGGVQLWLAADTSTKWQDAARTTPAILDTDPVGAWDDLSGLGRHALQTTAANRPLLKLAIQNGLPVLRLDGTNDYLVTAAFGVTLTQPITGFAVAKYSAATANKIITDGISTSLRFVLWNGAATHDLFAGAGLTGPAFAQTWRVLSAVANGASSLIGVNGTTTTGNAGAQSINGITVGAQFGFTGNFNGDIAEIIFYNRALSTAERRQIEAYLGAKYGITVV